MKRPNGYTFEELRRVKKIIIALIILAVIAAIYFSGYAIARGKFQKEVARLEEENQTLSDPVVVYETATQKIDLAEILSEIRDIGELATVEYFYTDASEYQAPAEFFGEKIPLDITTKSFIAKWDGTIKAGIDVAKVTVEENKANKTITVSLPPVQILSHVTDNYETLFEKDGLFNEIRVDDVREFDETCKKTMEEKAIDRGLLENAEANAKVIIEKLVNTDAVKELGYHIVFQELKNE